MTVLNSVHPVSRLKDLDFHQSLCTRMLFHERLLQRCYRRSNFAAAFENKIYSGILLRRAVHQRFICEDAQLHGPEKKHVHETTYFLNLITAFNKKNTYISKYIAERTHKNLNWRF